MSNSMNFTQLVSAVYTETNRPDLVAETQQAVFASTLKLHGLDFFYKDIFTAQVVFDEQAYIQTLDTVTLPRFRKFAYFRKDDPSIYGPYEQSNSLLPPLSQSITGQLIPMSVARRFLRFIHPDDIIDNYGAEKTDVAYQAGSTLMIKSSTLLQYGLAGWYSWPNCDIANSGAAYSSWIASEYPYAIIYDAASAILQKIGMTDAARKYDAQPNPNNPQDTGGLVQTQIRMLLQDNVNQESV